MLDKPLLQHLSKKTYDLALISFVTIMYITMCAEADMYVPAFPQMIEYFGVGENKIQLTLSINFIGLCFAGLIVGPISDAYGRRSVLIWGLLLFVVSSYGCMQSERFLSMLFWRLIQGISASVPMVIGAAAVLDRHPPEKAGQLIGVINSVITASMAGAPIVGALLSVYFGWRANFVTIFIFALISFLGTLLFIEETLPKNSRKQFNLYSILKDYSTLSRSFVFMGYAFIVNFSFNAIVVYISNLSVIFINHLGMSLEVFSFYQATTMATFVIFSLISVKIIGSKGLDYTKNLGGVLAIIGSLSLYIVAAIDDSSVNLICLSMAIVAAGGALMAGTFGMRALEIFPEMKGTALGMMTAIRQICASISVLLSEILFDGTIAPVAQIIFAYAFICTLIFALINSNKRVNIAS
jgi:DHA1 family bicyclomycin/chloramphenicol resistance-like MFS transporter